MRFKEFKESYKQLQTDEDRRQFIDNRIIELINLSDNRKEIGNGLCGSYGDFISPQTGLKSNGSSFYPNLVLDDNMYLELMNFINHDINTFMYGEPPTINVIQQFIWNYFGPNSSGYDAREEFYADYFGDSSISIKTLKGKNIAACSERSAMVHNLLTFLGLNSEVVFGNLNNTPHAYVIFKPENGNFRILYDPMNPVEYEIQGTKNYCPGMSLITEEQYQQLQNGMPCTFDYNLVKRLFVGNNPCNELQRRYFSDEYKFKKDDELVQARVDYIKIFDEPPTVVDIDLVQKNSAGIHR